MDNVAKSPPTSPVIGATNIITDENSNNNKGKILEIQAHHTEEEVKERLFTLPDPNQVKEETSALWGWFKQATVETANKLKEETSRKVLESTSTLKNALETTISATSGVLAATEQQDNPTTTPIVKQPFMLPWEPLDSMNSTAIREKVLALSKDENTFLVPPPVNELSATTKSPISLYNFQQDSSPALKMLEADPLLSAKRFKLVPKRVDENVFWSNYFYRVQMIKDSFGNGDSRSITVEEVKKKQVVVINNDGGGNKDLPNRSITTSSTSSTGGGGVVIINNSASDPNLSHENSNSAQSKSWEESLKAELSLADESNFEMLDDEELLAGVEE